MLHVGNVFYDMICRTFKSNHYHFPDSINAVTIR